MLPDFSQHDISLKRKIDLSNSDLAVMTPRTQQLLRRRIAQILSDESDNSEGDDIIVKRYVRKLSRRCLSSVILTH